MPKRVYGLVGPIASGKGTVAKILKEKGYKLYSLSDVLKKEVTARGLEITRYNCNAVSNELRNSEGADILAKKTSELIDQENPEFAVIDAIRNPLEIEFLKGRYNAQIIGVVADQKRRFELFAARGTFSSEIQTWEQFKELDDRELAQEGDHKQQINKCLEMSDITIENNSTVEDLKEKVEKVIN